MNFLLKTNQETNSFLSTRPDPDEIIVWCCPRCHSKNYGTYFSHATRCGVCDTGIFPPIPLPIIEDGSTSIARAYFGQRLKGIEEEIRETKYSIQQFEEEIEECECHLRELDKEKEEIKSLWVLK